MLNYLVQVTSDLLVLGVLVGLAFAYGSARWARFGSRGVAAGLAAGAVFGLVMGIMKNTTRLIDTGLWNMRLYVTYDVALIAFLIVALLDRKDRARDTTSSLEIVPGQQSVTRLGIASSIILAVLVFCRAGYSLTDTLVYPMTFDLSNNTVLSTDFIFRLVGWLAGLVLVGLLAMALAKQARGVRVRTLGPAFLLVLMVVALTQTMTLLQTMLARRIIPQSHDLFLVIKFFSNNLLLFQLVVAALALAVAIGLLVVAARTREPYANPAQHRRIKARWRNRRRWAVASIVCLVLCGLTITVVNDLNSREVELSPSEDSVVRDGNVYVGLNQVDDGHLHRFTYTTEGGVGIRFIVIKKPNASSYGVGLDACDICGETGYFERDGQVVCKLCDVVMNVNTIGFKGGCNPIVIDYSIADGNIIVPIEGLVAYEDTFKS